MVAPIVIDLAPSPAPEADLVRTLIASCSGAAGADGCVLGDAPDAQGAAADGRPHVVVSFLESSARIRVVLLAPGEARPAAVREITFREGDPLSERFRAAGLVAAALVFHEGPPAPATEPGPAPAPTAEVPPAPGRGATPDQLPARWRAPVLAAGGLLGISIVRPRAGAWVGADVPFAAGPGFAEVSVSYEQTWRPDRDGISEQREKLGIGAGLRWRLGWTDLAVRLPAELEVEHLRVAVVQPGTGRQDAGSRVLFGLCLGADLTWSIGDGVGVFLGARGTLLSDPTNVRVAGSPVTVVPAWEASLALGLDVRIP